MATQKFPSPFKLDSNQRVFCFNNNTMNENGDLMMTWLAGDVRRGFTPTKGRNSFYWNSLFSLHSPPHIWMKRVRVESVEAFKGVRVENYVFIFITQTREKIFYIATHMISRLSFPVFVVYSVWAAVEKSERRRSMREHTYCESAMGEGILLLLFLSYTHDGLFAVYASE